MKRHVTLLFFCIILSGCAKEQIIDRIKLIQSIGCDMQGDTLKVSGTYRAYEKKANLFLLEGEVKSLNDVLTPFTSQSDHPIAVGQLRTLVISEELARKGISELASTIVRDPLISNRSTLVLTTDQSSDILTETLKYPPNYLSNLIKHNMENGNIPSTNGHIFLDQYFGEGQDVFLPLLVKGPKDVLQMDGVGVFRDDKLRLLLTNEKGLFIKLLKDDKNDIRSSTYNFKNDQDEQISFKIIYSERKMTVENEIVTISLKLDIDLGAYPAALNVFENNNDMLHLKQQIENSLTAKIKAMLENFQENLVDPIGIGNLYSTRHKKWNEQEFTAQIYPNMKFNVSTEVEILSLGVGQ
ncbi:Ger(x)C family spore germination protein [Paenibacillus sp. 5J-6]|uniref:Ger(X)C family spore germination protein n=1 Tax=Paenibacillus silvestris TaxID=2606219 RepID=A0A6L8USW9_9BACL|nr:Ger(x)C family spore germination protein [Paenibacillus silvestris]MZQ81203.1 Ger(x)C family spore germination protein [Paenibacillus silvestris]